MSEPDTSSQEGAPDARIGRREAIRRAALVGGTVVWAAPAVQRIASSTAFAAVSPPPGPPPPPDSPPPPPPPTYTYHGISFIAFVFRCDNKWYKAKYDAETGAWEEPGSLTSHCAVPNRWSDAKSVPAPYNAPPNKAPFGISVNTDSEGEVTSITVTLPSGCSFDAGTGGVSKGGSECLQISGSGSSITFTAPPRT